MCSSWRDPPDPLLASQLGCGHHGMGRASACCRGGTENPAFPPQPAWFVSSELGKEKPPMSQPPEDVWKGDARPERWGSWRGQRGKRELVPGTHTQYSAWGKHCIPHPRTVPKILSREEDYEGLPPQGVPPGVLRTDTPPPCALPLHGAPHRQRHRQGGRLLSRRPADVSGCRGAARGCSWHSQSEGTAGEGHRSLSALSPPSSLPCPGALQQRVRPWAWLCPRLSAFAPVPRG